MSSDKIDKYEYLTGEELLPSDQSSIIERTNFTYSFLGKAFEKQIAIEDQVKAGNTSETLLNETRQIIYSLYQAKEITQTLYSNIMNSVKV